MESVLLKQFLKEMLRMCRTMKGMKGFHVISSIEGLPGYHSTGFALFRWGEPPGRVYPVSLVWGFIDKYAGGLAILSYFGVP